MFFTHTYHPAQVSVSPFFRLLSDIDCYAQQLNQRERKTHCQPVQQWKPRFDVRETAESYVLYGELPGLNKENISIEFSDPQTLTVRGRSERTYAAAATGDQAKAQVEETPAPDTVSEEGGKENRRNSYQATVEDEDEASDRESGFEVIETEDEKSAASTHVNEEAQQQESKPVDSAKYWLSERRVGEFSRTFQFPARVESEAVNARFENGILTVSVPKAKKYEARRIVIA